MGLVPNSFHVSGKYITPTNMMALKITGEWRTERGKVNVLHERRSLGNSDQWEAYFSHWHSYIILLVLKTDRGEVKNKVGATRWWVNSMLSEQHSLLSMCLFKAKGEMEWGMGRKPSPAVMHEQLFPVPAPPPPLKDMVEDVEMNEHWRSGRPESEAARLRGGSVRLWANAMFEELNGLRN